MTTVDTIAVTGAEVELFDAPPARRALAPTDVLRLVVGLVVVAGGALIASSAQSTVAGLEDDLLRALARLPDRFEDVLLSMAQLVTSVVPTVVLVALLVRRRFVLALLLIAAGTIGTVAMAVADAVVLDQDLQTLIEELRTDDVEYGTLVDPSFPDSAALASTTAIVVVAGPFLSRRWRRTLWWLVSLLVLLRLVAVAHPAFDFVLAIGIGLAVGSALLILFGSPQTEPAPTELLAALTAIGFDPRRVRRPAEQRAGAIRYDFDDRDGQRYGVTLRTPDERDADVFARAYRRIRFQASERGLEYASVKRRIEHEALVRALADRAGVQTDPVVSIGTTAGGSAFLVTAADDLRAAQGADLEHQGRLRELWQQVDALHEIGVAHRRLTLEAMRVRADGRMVLVDLDSAQTAPAERERARDVAELLVETALVVGSTTAVAVAIEVIGPRRVASAVRMLQPLALPTATRARIKGAPTLLDDLRQEISSRTGASDLELEDLERVRPRTVVLVGASALAFYSLLPQLVNLQDTVEAFGDARPPWIVATLVASAATYTFAALSFQGAVADDLPFLPNVRAQMATSFAGLVGPSGAGGFALTARFLERNGVGAAESAAAVAVNAVAGFVVHVVLMLGFFVWSGNAGIGGFSLPDASLIMLVLAGLSLVVGVLSLIGPVRSKLLVPALGAVRTALGQVGQVFQSPARVVALFGGSAGITLTYLIGVTAAIHAFGGDLSFAQIGAAYLGAVTLATVSPTPGGLGALESAMIAGFTGFGLDPGVAVSATLTFRLATFWLPILPGWLALGHMQRHAEL